MEAVLQQRKISKPTEKPSLATATATGTAHDHIASMKSSALSRTHSYSSLSPKRKQEIVDRTVSVTVSVIQKVTPVLDTIQKGSVFLAPYLVMTQEMATVAWVCLQPYHPEEFAPALLGLFMALFGGFYFTTFAAIEAYRVCGWQRTVECLRSLYVDCQLIYDAHLLDNEEDADGNGIKDVLEMPAKELAIRKMNLILTTMDPLKVADAISGISMGFVGVVASLRVQFAQTIAIGVTLGDITRNVVEPIAEPVLSLLVPQQYKRWIPVVIIYGSKLFGVSLAWTVHRVISAFYSAVRGAELFAKGLSHFLERNGIQLPLEDDSSAFALMVCGVATVGFLTQVFSGFSLPFPFNLLLFPLTVIEWLLMWIVAVK